MSHKKESKGWGRVVFHNCPLCCCSLSSFLSCWRSLLPLSLTKGYSYQPEIWASQKAPGCWESAGSLLDTHFASYQKNSVEALLSDVDTYGLRIYGDGDTIVITPTMNILASSPNNPRCFLGVIDCNTQMVQGGKKDASFIAKSILPIMKKMILTKTE